MDNDTVDNIAQSALDNAMSTIGKSASIDSAECSASSYHPAYYPVGQRRRPLIVQMKRCIQGVIEPSSGFGLTGRLFMTAVSTFLLAKVITKGGDVKVAPNDVLAYSAIYCFWVIFCLPDLLLSLNFQVLCEVIAALLRLFAAELGVTAYAWFRGQDDLSRLVLGMRPVLGGELRGIVDMMSTVRYALLIGTLSATAVAHLFERPQVLDDYGLFEESNESLDKPHKESGHPK
ncbi:hypothetical protein BaRGS_00017056 [Batillaria attramentaria]|uniref:Abscisic acid G-protein coupled receptor-like domain-containing protein n=1 Tax=Batillaria attramentaria TaxID=370345 RepID=A0ABD0KWC3_9CAEN|nr:hypothetical protein BaRGS_016211 [Batillaria attramentaria]